MRICLTNRVTIKLLFVRYGPKGTIWNVKAIVATFLLKVISKNIILFIWQYCGLIFWLPLSFMNLKDIFSYCWYLWGHYMVQSSSSPPHCEAWQPTAKGNNPPLTSVMQHPLLWHFLLKNTSTNIMIGPPKYDTAYWKLISVQKKTAIYTARSFLKSTTPQINQC